MVRAVRAVSAGPQAQSRDNSKASTAETLAHTSTHQQSTQAYTARPGHVQAIRRGGPSAHPFRSNAAAVHDEGWCRGRNSVALCASPKHLHLEKNSSAAAGCMNGWVGWTGPTLNPSRVWWAKTLVWWAKTLVYGLTRPWIPLRCTPGPNPQSKTPQHHTPQCDAQQKYTTAVVSMEAPHTTGRLMGPACYFIAGTGAAIAAPHSIQSCTGSAP
jgi:hypothetical protein